MHGFLEIRNFSSCVQLDISVFCYALHSWDISKWTHKEKFHITTHPCTILIISLRFPKIPTNSKGNSPSKLDLFAISQKFPHVFSPIPRNSKIFLLYSFACLGINWNSQDFLKIPRKSQISENSFRRDTLALKYCAINM